MISLPKNIPWNFVGRFLMVVVGVAVLFGSLILTGLEILANENGTDELRTIPIEYTKEMDNGEKILRTYKVPESEVGPDDAKYLLKKMRDELWINLSKTPKEETEVCLLVADKRMFEAVELIKEEKDCQLVEKTLGEAVDNLKRAKNSLIKETNKVEINNLKQKVDQAGLAYEDIVKSFNYKSEKMENIINDLEIWNQKNQEEK